MLVFTIVGMDFPRFSRTALISILFALLLAGLAQPAAAAGPLCFVDASAAGANDSTSWADAYTDLQDALNDPGCSEIWVAAGTYKPGPARADSFALESQQVYGGFNGTETTRAQRDWLLNITILSGDVNGNDGGINVNYGDNNYHVVDATGSSNARLDGFTVRSGSADGSGYETFAGGILVRSASALTLTNLLITLNTASNAAGALYAEQSSVTLTNVDFSINIAPAGGAIESILSQLTLNNVTIQNNDASIGGGILHEVGTLTLNNVTFFNNSTLARGGGLYTSQATLSVSNATFFNNDAVDDGGAMYLDDTDITLMNNVTVNLNGAPDGGGLYLTTGTNGTISNSILWDNDDDIENPGGGAITIVDSIVGTCPGTVTCINVSGADPLLGVFQPNGGFSDTKEPGAGSPAIDTGGDNSVCAAKDQRGTARPQGPDCDMGAVEVDETDPAVASTNVLNHYAGSGPSMLLVTFNEGMNDIQDSNGGHDDVTNPDNYFLVEAGVNAFIDTIACQGGLEPDDTNIAITFVSYNSTTFRATLTLANALPEGMYRLYICGSTSNRDIALNLLNAGNDVTVDFTVGPAGAAAPAAGAGSPDDLPDTGFAPGGVSVLAAQPAAVAYAASDLQLIIPSLGVELDIVGVPLVDGAWDVSWLPPSQAGYLQGTAWPTWVGNSAISAHVWNADNSAGPFYNLKNLQHGDQFTIVAWGHTYTYEVRTNRLVSDRNLSVLRDSEFSLITLITCEHFNDASGEYLYRRAVQAVLISVE